MPYLCECNLPAEDTDTANPIAKHIRLDHRAGALPTDFNRSGATTPNLVRLALGKPTGVYNHACPPAVVHTVVGELELCPGAHLG